MKRSEQVFIPFKLEVRVQAALHQDAGPAKRNRLVYLLINFVERADVGFRVARSAIERAESADDVADVRIIDVAVDDVGDDAFWMASPANLVGGQAYPHEIIRLKQTGAILCRQSLARESAIKYWLDVGGCHKNLAISPHELL